MFSRRSSGVVVPPVQAAFPGRGASLVEGLEGRLLFAATTFTLDPALSTLRLAGEVAGVIELEEQHSGSLQAAYEGTIVADVEAGSIEFLGGSDIVARSKGTYDPGSAPANYGGEGETGGFLSIKVGEAAIRGLKLDLTSSLMAVGNTGDFAANGVTFETTAGALEYDLRTGDDGTINLAGESMANVNATVATLTGSGDNRTLTIPIDITFSEDNAELRLRGKLVAKSGTGGGDSGGENTDPSNVRIGAGGSKSVAFADADGTTAVVALRGGAAQVRFENATGITTSRGVSVVTGEGVRLAGIDATGTNARSKLTLRGAGGSDGTFDVPALTASGPLNTLGGAGANFTGTTSINGPVAKLTASNLTGATITADSIGKIAVANNVTDSTITLSTPFVEGATAAKRFNVGGTMTNSRLSAAGSLGNVKITNLTDSEVFAGVTGASRLPDPAVNLPTAAGIGKIVLSSMTNSVIAAKNLGKVTLGVISTTNAEQSGIVADSVTTLTATNGSTRLRLVQPQNETAVTAELERQNFESGDFQIRIV